MVFPYFFITEDMAFHTFDWDLKGVAFPSLPLPDDYRELCLNFVLSEAEKAAWNYPLPKIVQVVFYAMVLSDALELGVLNRELAEMLKSALVGMW